MEATRARDVEGQRGTCKFRDGRLTLLLWLSGSLAFMIIVPYRYTIITIIKEACSNLFEIMIICAP